MEHTDLGFRALRPLLFVEDEPIATLHVRLQQAPGAEYLDRADVLHHLLQRASLLCESAQAPSLFAEVPGPARRRVICAYTASVDDTGLAATRELAVGALKAAKTQGGSKAETFVQIASAAVDALARET